MAQRNIAKLFMHGRSQAVRLPKEFRFPGTEVKVTRTNDGVLLQPMMARTPEEIAAVFRELEKYHHIPFMENGREQPPMPDDDDELTFD